MESYRKKRKEQFRFSGVLSYFGSSESTSGPSPSMLLVPDREAPSVCCAQLGPEMSKRQGGVSEEYRHSPPVSDQN